MADQRIQGVAFGPASQRPNSRVVREESGDARCTLAFPYVECDCKSDIEHLHGDSRSTSRTFIVDTVKLLPITRTKGTRS